MGTFCPSGNAWIRNILTKLTRVINYNYYYSPTGDNKMNFNLLGNYQITDLFPTVTMVTKHKDGDGIRPA